MRHWRTWRWRRGMRWDFLWNAVHRFWPLRKCFRWKARFVSPEECHSMKVVCFVDNLPTTLAGTFLALWLWTSSSQRAFMDIAIFITQELHRLYMHISWRYNYLACPWLETDSFSCTDLTALKMDLESFVQEITCGGCSEYYLGVPGESLLIAIGEPGDPWKCPWSLISPGGLLMIDKEPPEVTGELELCSFPCFFSPLKVYIWVSNSNFKEGRNFYSQQGVDQSFSSQNATL